MILPCGEGNIVILPCGTIRGLWDTNQLTHPKQGSLEYNALVRYIATPCCPAWGVLNVTKCILFSWPQHSLLGAFRV